MTLRIHYRYKAARRAVSVGVGLTTLLLAVLVTISVAPAEGVASPGGAISIVAQNDISNPQQITAGPDGSLWFTSYNNNSIGKVELLQGRQFDFNGDGSADRGVYRNGGWLSPTSTAVYFGNSTDTPVPADYNGDGTAERMIYRNGGWLSPTTTPVYLGLATDTPLSLSAALR